MKRSVAVLTLAFISMFLICLFILRRSPPSDEPRTLVSEPYSGIRLNPNQFSNAVLRAEAGSITDAMSLADDYYFANNDVTNGIKYLKQAANEGSKIAAFNLGQLYSTDLRIRDLKESEYWYTIAKNLGDTMATEKIKNLQSP